MLSLRSVPLVVLGLAVACGDPPTEDMETTATTGATEASSETTADVPTGDGPTGPGCVEGEVTCEAGDAVICVAGMELREECAGGCLDGVGCVSCEPGTTVCDGDSVVVCGDDGEPGGAIAECDPVQGLACDAGACTGACAFDPARGSEVGCEFHALPLPSSVVADGGFGVALTNTCDATTNLRIDAAGSQLFMLTLMPQETRFIELPRLPPLYNADVSVLTGNGGYRVRTDCPVLAVQTSGGPELASVDASRLYPTDRWGTEVRVATRVTSMFDDMSPVLRGYVAIVARDDDTTVSIALPAGVTIGAAETIGADGSGEVVMKRSEVLLLGADLPHDLSGAVVTADRPIGVFGGHECSNVPFDVGFCDHLEEVLPPVAALGSNYVVVPPISTDMSGPAEHVVQVIGTADGTTVMSSGMMMGMVDAGGVLEFPPMAAALEITASAPVLVGQYHVGKEEDPLASDPAMVTPTPTDQYRTDHAFWTAEDWSITVAEVVAPMGATAALDGVDVAGWAPIAGTNWVSATVTIDTAGAHALTADMPVGITVYGLKNSGSVASYAYAGAWSWPAP